uniref:Uncharacterized protein n=1 Tax=Anguilla anguilla TaxID=7936 RepID=A0A0E9UJL5_ANGAN
MPPAQTSLTPHHHRHHGFFDEPPRDMFVSVCVYT